jgi:hypothetical protein
MSELDDLLDAAANADQSERIDWRDPIAEHGQAAIPMIRQWLTNPALGAFAVRVLEKIGERPDDRRAAVAALERIDAAAVPDHVARDIASALDRLGAQRRRASTTESPRAASKAWSGYPSASPLEQRFHDDMLDIFRLAGEATRRVRPDGTVERGYWASYFLRGVRNHGGLAYAHQLLREEGTTDGFKRLTAEGRLDLTMEALVLRPQYASLFSESERQVAASRLAGAGYEPPRA